MPAPDSGGCRAVLLLFLAAVAVAQRAPADPDVDPFTMARPERMAAVGIEAYAPMPWAGRHNTIDIETELGKELKIRWAETRHFKIGIGLADRPWPKDKHRRRELKAEVDQWLAKLPRSRAHRVKRPGKITSWLLVHLYAQRLEQLYAAFCRRSGFDDQAVAVDGHGHDGQGWEERGGMGKGPFLGQHGKYCLLVLEKRGDLARYLRRWADRQTEEGACHHFLESNSLVYVTTPDVRNKSLGTERALHCNVVYGTVRNFVTGFGGFGYEVPAWNVEGLAHWYRRRLDTEYNSIAALPESQWSLLHNADWASKTRGRVKTGAYAAATELMGWWLSDFDDFHKHVMVWARVDFLMSRAPDRYGAYLGVLKELPSGRPSRDEVLAQQLKALQAAYGFDAAGFDAAWREWVEANYRRK